MSENKNALSETVNENNNEGRKTSLAYELNKRTILNCLKGLKTEEDPDRVATLLEMVATSFTSSRRGGFSHTVHLSEDEKEILRQIPNPVLQKLYRRMETLSSKGHQAYITPENEWAMFFLHNCGDIFSS